MFKDKNVTLIYMPTYKEKFNMKHNQPKDTSNSLAKIAKLSGIKKSALQDIYNKGVGAYKTNPGSVRPNVKSKEQWAMARVYSSVMGGKAAKVDKKELERGKSMKKQTKQDRLDEAEGKKKGKEKKKVQNVTDRLHEAEGKKKAMKETKKIKKRKY